MSILASFAHAMIDARLRSAMVKVSPSSQGLPLIASFSTRSGFWNATFASSTAFGFFLSGGVMNISTTMVSSGFSTSVMPQKLHW